MKKAILILLLLAAYLNGVCQYNRMSLYVLADPDQWQLFMGLNAYDDLVMNDSVIKNKVVFIYVTAGDESCNGTTLNTSEYLTRQAGAHNAVEFCADKSHPHCQLTAHHDVIMGHAILKYNYNNVVSYFLRLPDGCSGKSLSGQSLQLLHDGAIASISAIDSTATFTGWSDLVGTMQQIIAREQHGLNYIYANTADTNTTINKGDDPDHVYAGMLCMDALDSQQHLTINLFQEAVIATLPSNVDDMSIATKAALLSQLDYTRTENGLPSEWTPLNISYLSRNYFRTIQR